MCVSDDAARELGNLVQPPRAESAHAHVPRAVLGPQRSLPKLEEVIRDGEEEGCQEEGHEEGCEEEEVTTPFWTWHVLGGLTGSEPSVNPRFLIPPSGIRRRENQTIDMSAPEPVPSKITPARRPAVAAPRRVAARSPRVAGCDVELGFGPHLVFDGYRCPEARLSDLDRTWEFLDRLPERIGMTKIMPPYVFRHAERDPAHEGLSGFVLIAESHISVHTFPSKRFVNADVFSCEPFDVQKVLAELKKMFSPTRMEWKLLDRGREFPKSIGQSRAAVAQDRWHVARSMGLEVSR